MDDPVFLLGSHKSGSSLLRSLLDGSPDLFVVPLEAHFFQFAGYWVDYALRRSWPEHLDRKDLVERFTQHIQHSHLKSTATSDGDLTGIWDVQKFKTHLEMIIGKSGDEEYQFRFFLDQYIEAIHMGLFGTLPSATRFVEKSVENAEYAVVLRRLFPNAKFIHLVRNPYATLSSLRKHMARKQYPFLGNAISSLYNSYYYLYKNPLVISDYQIIRYEDLITETENIMRKLADFIGIEFTDNLLQPTVLGRPWQGNSTSGESYTSISQAPLVNWKTEIQPLEISLVNRLLNHVLRDYNYERLVPGNIYRFSSGEKLRNYLRNRMFWLVVKRSKTVLV